MMAMLWSVAMGKTTIGVDMRGDPFLGVHWNIREDFYHQLGLIDKMMWDRFGGERMPKRANGELFWLAKCFYDTETAAGDIVADEIIDGYDSLHHIAGTIKHVEFIDDRHVGGVPARSVFVLPAPIPPNSPDGDGIRRSLSEILDGPSMFQASAAAILTLLRRYLEAIEIADVALDIDKRRVRILNRHRAVKGGIQHDENGNLTVELEELHELDFEGKFLRVKVPGSKPIYIKGPELCMIAQGFESDDARELGFKQKDISIDHGDGLGRRTAQADYVAGLVEILIDGRLRRRIKSSFDSFGKEYWVRQIAVGHENDPEVGWILVQVPDYLILCPISAGILDKSVCKSSAEYYSAYQAILYDFFIKEASEILHLPPKVVKGAQMVYGPKLFSLVERCGDDPLILQNVVVAGDSYGNGHFMTSGGAMTGMVGHSMAVLDYWRARAAGTETTQAARVLADSIRQCTEEWLAVSATEFTQAAPVNFGRDRVQQIESMSGAEKVNASQDLRHSDRRRHTLIPLDSSDWRRPLIRNGRVISAPLPALI
jgi:hypothetical protein